MYNFLKLRPIFNTIFSVDLSKPVRISLPLSKSFYADFFFFLPPMHWCTDIPPRKYTADLRCVCGISILWILLLFFSPMTALLFCLESLNRKCYS